MTWSRVALVVIVVLGLCLRLRGIHSPIIDHPDVRRYYLGEDFRM